MTLLTVKRRVACLVFGHHYDKAWPYSCPLCGKVDPLKSDRPPWTLTDL